VIWIVALQDPWSRTHGVAVRRRDPWPEGRPDLNLHHGGFLRISTSEFDDVLSPSGSSLVIVHRLTTEILYRNRAFEQSTLESRRGRLETAATLRNWIDFYVFVLECFFINVEALISNFLVLRVSDAKVSLTWA
jgi:hypothetical protein